MSLISIVVVTWNSQAVIQECVDSLFRHVPADQFELLLVDNASRDGRYLDAFEQMPNVKVIRNTGNFGFSKAVNIGLRAARGTHFLTLNPDMIFTENPFPGLLALLESKPEIGVVGPLLYGTDDRPQIHQYYPKFPSIPQFLVFRSILHDIPPFPAIALRYFHSRVGTSGVHYVDQIPGAFLLFRRDLFGDRDALNESYFIWLEDVDFCLRVHRMRRKVAVLADSRITHIGGTSFDAWTDFHKRVMFGISYLTYLRVNYGVVRFWLHTGVMFVDSLLYFLLTPRYLIRFGFEGMKKRLALQAKMVGLISRAILSPFIPGTKNAPLKYPV